MSAASFLHSSFLQAISAVMLWPVHFQKVPQASEHLCPVIKLCIIRCDIRFDFFIGVKDLQSPDLELYHRTLQIFDLLSQFAGCRSGIRFCRCWIYYHNLQILDYPSL